MIDNIQKFFQDGILSTNKGKIAISIFSLSAVCIFIFSFISKNSIFSSFLRALIGSFISTVIVSVMYIILEKILSPIFDGKDTAEQEESIIDKSERELEPQIEDDSNTSYSREAIENTSINDLNSNLDDIQEEEKLDKSANVDYYQKSTLDKSLDKSNEANDTIDSIIFPKPKPVAVSTTQASSDTKSEYTQVGKNNIEIPSDPEMIAKAVRTMRAKEEENKG